MQERQIVGDIAKCLGCPIKDCWHVVAASTGLFDIMVQVDDLAHIEPDFSHMTHISELNDVVGIHAFQLTHDEGHIKVRNFAPRFGINEESATGTSNCALACLLRKRGFLT